MLPYITLNTSYTKENTVTPVNEVVPCNPPKQGSLKCPISRSLTTSCVGLELRPLPSPGITRLQWYYWPLRHPSAPGLSLTGVRLIIPDHAVGLPVLRALSLCTCCRHYPGAAAGCILRPSHPAVSAFPGRGRRVGLHIDLFEIPCVLWVAIDSASK